MVVYNLYFHPLSRIPGPKTWAATRLTFIRSVWKGSLVHDVQKIHRQYGDIVRLAPDEVSFARGEAWSEIFGHRPGHLPFPKNPVWWSPPQGQTPSLLHVQDEGAHARMRRVLAHSFTEKALRTQEPLIQSYVDLLIKRLRERTAENTHSEGTVLDIVQWYNYTTFDIIGDLGLGQSFDCLQQSTLHPWVAMIYNFFKVSTYLATVRFYPSIEFLLRKCIPKSALKMQRDHYQLVVDRVDRRMNLETQRDDFMSQLLKHNDKTGMSVDEIRSTFNTLIVAGSETTATVLSGITNYLVQNTGVLQKLVQEIRGPFEEEKNITIGSLQTLAYLNAVIEEGLRLCPPVPAGLPRVVPAGGDTVCGQWLPEHVSLS